MSVQLHPAARSNMGQSVARTMPSRSTDLDVYNRIDNSLVCADYTDGSWIAKVAEGAMTNGRALRVLATIERKLAGKSSSAVVIINSSPGYEKGSEQPLEVDRQVQLLIAEATEPANLAQGEWSLQAQCVTESQVMSWDGSRSGERKPMICQCCRMLCMRYAMYAMIESRSPPSTRRVPSRTRRNYPC
jgi:hypothetical protein